MSASLWKNQFPFQLPRSWKHIPALFALSGPRKDDIIPIFMIQAKKFLHDWWRTKLSRIKTLFKCVKICTQLLIILAILTAMNSTSYYILAFLLLFFIKHPFLLISLPRLYKKDILFSIAYKIEFPGQYIY